VRVAGSSRSDAVSPDASKTVPSASLTGDQECCPGQFATGLKFPEAGS
jgi:hypothetical protein